MRLGADGCLRGGQGTGLRGTLGERGIGQELPHVVGQVGVRREESFEVDSFPPPVRSR
jgi:hypothetical protein